MTIGPPRDRQLHRRRAGAAILRGEAVRWASRGSGPARAGRESRDQARLRAGCRTPSRRRAGDVIGRRSWRGIPLRVRRGAGPPAVRWPPTAEPAPSRRLRRGRVPGKRVRTTSARRCAGLRLEAVRWARLAARSGRRPRAGSPRRGTPWSRAHVRRTPWERRISSGADAGALSRRDGQARLGEAPGNAWRDYGGADSRVAGVAPRDSHGMRVPRVRRAGFRHRRDVAKVDRSADRGSGDLGPDGRSSGPSGIRASPTPATRSAPPRQSERRRAA